MPALIGATKIANMIVRPSSEDLLSDAGGRLLLNEELNSIGLKLHEVKIEADSALAGSTLGNWEISSSGGFVVVALRRADNTVIQNPEHDIHLAAGDTIVVLGHATAFPRLSMRAKASGATTYRGARTA